MRILSLMSAVMASAGLLAATPTVTAVTAQQRYPWNGKVDIVVTFNGASNDVAQATCTFTATNSATQAALAMTSVTEVGTDPVAAGTDPVTAGTDPVTAGTDPVTAGTDPTTWTRRYVWDATADLGEVKIADVAITAEAKTGVQLWANGPYWAECNVGASKPEEYGAYFWWGDTVGYKRVGSSWDAVDGSTTGFSFASENCPTHGKDASSLQSLGYIDATGNLVAAHDAATVHLGTPWRMPTESEMRALIENCTTTRTTRNGMYGRLVTGKGTYAAKSIFLPAAGYGCMSARLDHPDSYGYYWTSSSTWYLQFTSLPYSDECFQLDYFYTDNQSYKMTVRPLREFVP